MNKSIMRYHYQGVKYKVENLSLVFHDSEQVMIYYNDARSNYKKGRNQLITGGVLVSASLGLLTFITTKNVALSGIESIIVGVAVLSMDIGGLGYLIGGNIKLLKARNCMNAAVNHFNWEIQEKLEKEEQSLGISLTSNGVGLVYSF